MTRFIAARHFHTGRIAGVDVLVLHTAEGATDAAELGAYFRDTTREASSHSGVDDRQRVDYVHFDDTAWAAPGANADGEQLEICGFAAWTRAEWLRHAGMLDQVAAWLAERSRARAIPLVELGPADLRADRRGVTTHKAVSLAFKRSTHVDPGDGFPLDLVLARARQLLAGGKPATTAPAASKYVPAFMGTMRQGSRGARVLTLQRRLRQRGWSIGLDGIYGPQTVAVVRAFQLDKHLQVDGVVGPLTWRALWVAPIT